MILAWVVGTIVIAYLLGSVPFGLLLAQAAGIGDLRTIGSGNIGATNVMRTGHRMLGLLTLLLDVAKGFAAVWITRYLYSPDFAPIAGLIAVLGHVFPVWLRFKGGKGVATSLGAIFALDVRLGIAVAILWILVFAFTRTSSMASIISLGYSGILAYLLENDVAALLCLCFGAITLFTHRSNIKRLLQGSEYRFHPRRT